MTPANERECDPMSDGAFLRQVQDRCEELKAQVETLKAALEAILTMVNDERLVNDEEMTVRTLEEIHHSAGSALASDRREKETKGE